MRHATKSVYSNLYRSLMMMSAMISLTACSDFAALSGAGKSTLRPLSSSSLLNAGETGELINDPGLTRGILMKRACMAPDRDPACANAPTDELRNPYNPGAAPTWSGAQWGSLASLPANSGPNDGGMVYANEYKAITFYPDGRVRFAINGMAELGGQYQDWTLDRKWPHLLVEQPISWPGNLASGNLAGMKSMQFHFDAKLMYNERNQRAGYDPNKHGVGFLIYFSIQNLNQASPDFGKYVWLGVPVYSDREEFSETAIMHDDGTNMLIYSIGLRNFTNKSVHSGDWVSLDADILPHARAAVAEAARRGYFQGDFNDFYVGGMNMGYELWGLNITTIDFKGLSLRASRSAEVAEGYFRIGGGDGIMYSNGADAFCVFTDAEVFFRWRGGRRDWDNIGNIAGLPQSMRNDGVCQ